jgi:small subunit ribosomal protein S17
MPKRILFGEVVSDKNNKTVIVKVIRKYMHPVYKKILKRTKRYAAHDEANQYKIGDIVRIIESKPISATKTWVVMSAQDGGQ